MCFYIRIVIIIVSISIRLVFLLQQYFQRRVSVSSQTAKYNLSEDMRAKKMIWYLITMSLGHLETRVSGLGPEWQPLANGSELSLAVLDQVNIEVHRGIEHCQQVRYLTDFVRPGRPGCDLEDHVNGWYESILSNLSMFCLSKLPNIWYPSHSVTNNKHWILSLKNNS